MRQIILYPGEDGFIIAECPSLPGCISQGKSKEEAISNIREAIELYIESLVEDGLPVPEEKIETLKIELIPDVDDEEMEEINRQVGNPEKYENQQFERMPI